MKSKFFKFLGSIVMSCCMIILPMSSCVSAATNNIQPRYVASCPGGGKHQMRAIANAMLYSGTSPDNLGDLLYRGTASKCYNCSMMCFSQFYPGKTIKGLGLAKFDTNTYAGSQLYIAYGPYTTYSSLVQDDFIRGFEWN